MRGVDRVLDFWRAYRAKAKRFIMLRLSRSWLLLKTFSCICIQIGFGCMLRFWLLALHYAAQKLQPRQRLVWGSQCIVFWSWRRQLVIRFVCLELLTSPLLNWSFVGFLRRRWALAVLGVSTANIRANSVNEGLQCNDALPQLLFCRPWVRCFVNLL